MGKQALVLSGGSIKGAFQAGAVKQILSEGFEPEIIHGISVGSLNGAFLTNLTGKYDNNYKWTDLGDELVDFWLNGITKPESLVKKNSVLKLGWQLLRGKFESVLSTKPLKDLVHKTIEVDNFIKSNIDYTAGAVDLNSGNLKSFSKYDKELIEGVIASTTIPVMMPASLIGKTYYYDGGLREVAPLKSVIDKGATDIVVILCQSKDVSAQNFDHGNIAHMITRVMDIVTNETVNNDIRQTLKVNEIIRENIELTKNGVFKDKKKINIRLIRPDSELTLKIDKFDKKDIENMIELGRITAEKSKWQ
jgi:NTE family protein